MAVEPVPQSGATFTVKLSTSGALGWTAGVMLVTVINDPDQAIAPVVPLGKLMVGAVVTVMPAGTASLSAPNGAPFVVNVAVAGTAVPLWAVDIGEMSTLTAHPGEGPATVRVERFVCSVNNCENALPAYASAFQVEQAGAVDVNLTSTHQVPPLDGMPGM